MINLPLSEPAPPSTQRSFSRRRFERTKKVVALSTGIRMAYVSAGDPEGAGVIFLHGYTDSARSFFPTIQQLCDNDAPLCLYALDQRGHGESSMPQEPGSARAPENAFRIERMVADVIAFMNARRVRSAHIVGHAMGSLVAQELALRHPERIQSLLLIGTFVSAAASATFEHFLLPTIEGEWKRALLGRRGFRYPEDAYFLAPEAADPDLRSWLDASWIADVTAPPDHLAAVAPEAAATPLGTWIGALRMQQAFDSRTRLASLNVPTLVLWATQDNLFQAEPDQRRVLEALSAAVTGGQLDYFFYKVYGKRSLPRSGNPDGELGHKLHWAAAETVAADITSWVSKRRPTSLLPYADPDNPRIVRVDPCGARIIEVRRKAS
jgi:pimeloyl-ACP methyl ester carboxylesterase